STDAPAYPTRRSSDLEPALGERRKRQAGAVERDGRPRVHGRQLLEDEALREGAEPLAARAGGNVDRVEAERRELGHQRARHAAGALVGAETRPQAVVGEAARRLLDQALLLVQREAEHAPSFAPPGLRTQGVVEP